MDSSGTVSLPSGDIKFTRGIDFIKAVASTPELRDCVARQWLRYVLRRQEVAEEAGSVEALDKAFESSGWDVREMLVARHEDAGLHAPQARRGRRHLATEI